MRGASTLTGFLETIGYRLNYYDMGRRICQIARDDLMHFEQTNIPYPLPLQQQAWIGLLLNDASSPEVEPLIWFIRFPLDEQGKLILSARDEFLHLLVESVQLQQKAEKNRENLQNGLQNNPYVFRPRPERMANFHAKVTRLLQQPPSRFYEHALEYFNGKLGWEQWSFLGYQGIADIAVRHAMEGNHSMLALAIPHLPLPAFEALCHCLENEALSSAVSRALISRAEQALSDTAPDPRILGASLRGLSHSPECKSKQELVLNLLSHAIARKGDILAAISGRSWELLRDDVIRERFLECLAENDQGQELFNQILSDLLFLPDTRSAMLGCLRKQDRSKQLDAAIGSFFNQFKKH